MKKTGLIVTILLTGYVALAQEVPGNELDPSDSGVEELEMSPFEFGDGSKSATLSAVSLRMYCPRPRSQAGVPGGARLGLAFGYGAMTTLKARQNNWSAAQIAREAFSAWFPFELLTKELTGCQVNKYIAAIRKVLTESGNLKAAVYDTEPTSCRNTPSPAERQQAQRYRIDRLDKVFDLTSPDPQKLLFTRQALQEGRPVVVVMQVDRGFAPFRGETWRPNNDLLDQKPMNQPVVVIGYDDRRRAFEFMNSMGTAWGNGGFAWISYDNFVRRASIATKLVDRPDEPTPPSPAPNKVVVRPKPPVLLRGSGILEQLQDVSGAALQKTSVAVTHRGTHYETKGGFVTNDLFQLRLNQLPRYGYVYIFSVDPARKVELHFPQSGESAYVADDEARLVFPRTRIDYNPNGTFTRIEQGFFKERDGDDWLVMLYSKHPLELVQLNEWMARLAGSNATVMITLEQELGKQMVPWRAVRFDAQTMRFAVAADSPGSVVPLVLKINGR